MDVTGPSFLRLFPVTRKIFWVYCTAVYKGNRFLVVSGFFAVSTTPWPKINSASPSLLLQLQPDRFGSVVEFWIVIWAVIIVGEVLFVNGIPEAVWHDPVSLGIQPCNVGVVCWPVYGGDNIYRVLCSRTPFRPSASRFGVSAHCPVMYCQPMPSMEIKMTVSFSYFAALEKMPWSVNLRRKQITDASRTRSFVMVRGPLCRSWRTSREVRCYDRRWVECKGSDFGATSQDERSWERGWLRC